MNEELGVMIKTIRRQKKIPQRILCRGVCSSPELSRFENGLREVDSFVLSTLLERLGKTMNPFEMVVSVDEYHLILLRTVIQNALLTGRMDVVEDALEEYSTATEYTNKGLHEQYIGMIRAVSGYLKSRDVDACLCDLGKAMRISFSEEQDLIWELGCFSIQEYQMLLLMAYLTLEQGEDNTAEELLDRLIQCMEVREMSEGIKQAVYPKCCYLMAQLQRKKQNMEGVRNFAEKGMECLIENGSMVYLDKLLAFRRLYRNDEDTKQQIEALEFLRSFFEEREPEEDILKILFLDRPCEISLDSELLKDLRTARHYTQQELGDGICARETVSCIELGRKANQNKLRKMLTKLGVNRHTFYSYVEAEDFETYEIIREYKKNLMRGNFEQTEEVLESIARWLDLSKRVNKQFVETARILHKIKREKDYEGAIPKLEQCLKYTMPDYDGTISRIPYREEVIILNQIALCRKRSGNRAKAVELYQELYEKYEESEVLSEYHSSSQMLLYFNYFTALEEEDRLEEAGVIAQKGMQLVLRKYRGDTAALYLINLACVYEKQQTQEGDKLCEQCARYAYHLFKLFRCEKHCEAAKKYYDAKF